MQDGLRNTVTLACTHTSAHIITGQQGAVLLGPEKVVCERSYTTLADLLMAIGLTCCKEKRAFFAESCDVIGDYERYKVVDFSECWRASERTPSSLRCAVIFCFFSPKNECRFSLFKYLCCLQMSDPMRSETRG